MAVVSFEPAEPAQELPPLQNGDHLDQPTFHARYQAMPEHVRAELIGGIVFMASPVRTRHGRHTGQVIRWLGAYEDATPGVEALDSVTVIMGREEEPEPDALLRILPEYGGRTRENERGFLVGSPELVVEIAHATEAIDLHRKKHAYECAGVDEYLVVLLNSEEVRWFHLENGSYRRLEPAADGTLRSQRFPGLWLDSRALLRDDQRRLREVLQAGLASPEHAEWVARRAGHASGRQ